MKFNEILGRTLALLLFFFTTQIQAASNSTDIDAQIAEARAHAENADRQVALQKLLKKLSDWDSLSNKEQEKLWKLLIAYGPFGEVIQEWGYGPFGEVIQEWGYSPFGEVIQDWGNNQSKTVNQNNRRSKPGQSSEGSPNLNAKKATLI